MVTSATRWAPAFASTLNSTTPEPLPGDPDVTLSQLTATVAAQGHPAVVVTVAWKLPPLAPTDCAPEPDTAYSHAAGPCWTCARTPLTTIEACLMNGDGFGATSTRSVLLPCPEEGSMRATQLASAEAVHAHSGVVVSTTCSLPPAGLMAEAGAVSVNVHLSSVGSVDVTVDPQAASRALTTATGARRRNHRLNRPDTVSTTMNPIPCTSSLVSRLDDLQFHTVRCGHERRAE